MYHGGGEPEWTSVDVPADGEMKWTVRWPKWTIKRTPTDVFVDASVDLREPSI